MNSDVNFDFSVPVEPEELNVALYNNKENVTKLLNLTEEIDATVKRDKTPCNTTDLSWLFQEKCVLLDNIKQNLIDSDNDLFATQGEMFINLYDTLVKENIECKQTLAYLRENLQPQEENLAKMKEYLHQIEQNLEATKTSKINTPEMLDVNLLYKNSGEKMRIMRAKFHKLLDVDPNLKELIQDLTVAYFEGGDSKYIDKKKYIPSNIYTLKMSGLVIEDPYDDSRIKFDDII